MSKKRKSDVTGLDEVDRTMHATFCSAANSLSQLYTQAQGQQKLAFQAGERHGMKELDYEIQETSASPETQRYQHSQPQMMYSNSGSLVYSGGQTLPYGARPTHTDQHKDSIFLNGLSSPVRRSLQPFELAQSGYVSSGLQSGNGGRRAGSLDSCHHGVFNGLHGPPQDHDIGFGVDPLQICHSHPHENREARSPDADCSFMDIHDGSAVHNS
ncbi:unnamed protein product [Victoria cruziana]